MFAIVSKAVGAVRCRVDRLVRPGVCDDVGRWARRRGLNVIYLHDPIPHRTFPAEIYQQPPTDQRAATDYDLEKPQELIVLTRAKIRGATGIVYLPDGKVCLQGHWWPFIFALNEDHTRLRRRYVKTLQPGDLYSLLCTWGQHYYHWLHDVLPRLYTTLPYLPAGVRFLINRHPTPLQIESLAALGIGVDRLVYQDDWVDTVAERFWFSTPLGNTFFTAVPVLNEIAATLRRTLNPQPREAFRNIFISRALAKKRRIVNEEELRPALESRGFEFIQAEALDFRAQVQLFGEAKLILASHGAGLMNMLFMPPGGDIIEVFEPQTLYVHYWAMSADCAHRYHHLFGESVPNGTQQPDIRIESAPLLALVDAALSKRTMALPES